MRQCLCRTLFIKAYILGSWQIIVSCKFQINVQGWAFCSGGMHSCTLPNDASNVNSLIPSDVIWYDRTWSTSVYVTSVDCSSVKSCGIPMTYQDCSSCWKILQSCNFYIWLEFDLEGHETWSQVETNMQLQHWSVVVYVHIFVINLFMLWWPVIFRFNVFF